MNGYNNSMQINSRPVPLAKFRGRSQIGQQSLPNPTPGSLRITGNWSIQTANNALLYQQASCGISLFIQYNNYGSPHQGTIFKKGPFSLIINSFSGEAFEMEFTLTSTGSQLQYVQAFIYQAVYHIAISWNQSTQQQFAWINGVQVYSKNYNFEASINNQYAWLGWSDGGSGTPIDYQIANFAIWNGYSPTLQDVLKLRDGILNPSQVGRGATAWWPLGGPAGANPTLVDSGLHDYSGNGNHFLSLAGASTNAVYSGPLTYVSPTLVEPYVAKSGQTVYFFTLSNVPTPLLQNVTTVADNPAVSVNGNPIQIIGPYWHPNDPTQPPLTHACAFVAYQLVCGPVASIVVQAGGSGYTAPSATVTGGGGAGCVLGTPVMVGGVITTIPVTSPGANYTSAPTITITDGGSGSGATAVPVMAGVQPSDTVTYSAAASWCTAGSGAAPAATGAAVLNSAGSLEPAIGGMLPFNLPPSERTMLVGSDIDWPHSKTNFSFNAGINWIHRLFNPWTNAKTSTPDGHPMTITGTASSTFADNGNVQNFVDAHMLPTPTGVWTLVVDDTNAAAPIQFSVTSSRGTCSISTVFTEGARVGGSLIGRTWQFTVTRTSAANWNLGLTLNATIAGQGGTYAYTATNEFLFSPATSAAAAPGFPSRANPLTVDAAVARMARGQTSGLACMRFVDSVNTYGGIALSVDVDDLRSPTDFSWSGSNATGDPDSSRSFTVTAIRTYAPSGGAGFSGTAWGSSVTWTSGPVYLSAWHNAAGYPIDSLRINHGGTGYVSPTATAVPAVGDLGTGCVLGTPVLSGGVITSIPVTSAGSGYGSPPTIVIADSAGTGAIAMPMVTSTPATPSWLNNSGSAGTQWYAGECVTSTPHGLKTGQFLTVTVSTGTYSISNGLGAVIAGVNIETGGAVAFVTGPTTFAFTNYLNAIGAGSGSTLPGGMNNIAGTFTVNWTCTNETPLSGTMPWEAAASITAALPGCGIHLNLPVSGTDACFADIARRVRDNLPVGRQVIVEYSNENWNYSTSEVSTFAMGALGAWAPVLPPWERTSATRSGPARGTRYSSTSSTPSTSTGIAAGVTRSSGRSARRSAAAITPR